MFCTEVNRFVNCKEDGRPFYMNTFCLKVLDIKGHLSILTLEEKQALTKQRKLNYEEILK